MQLLSKKGCLLLFSGREHLLIPVPVIKEIIKRKDLPSFEQGYGRFAWRGTMLPVFYFPHLFETDNEATHVLPTHIVIMSGLDSEIDYYGLMTAGIPRSVWLNEEDIIEQREGEGAVKWHVRIEGYRCIIPNLDYLEQHIHQGARGE